jgi:hypothetical protein
MDRTETVFFLVKLFDKEEYAKAFLRGQLYMNSLKYFRELGLSADGRGDPDEGIDGLFQPSQGGQFKVGDHEISMGDIIGPIKIRSANNDELNLCCFFSANTSGLELTNEEDMDTLAKHLYMSPQCFEMGHSAVLIHNATEFFNRVETSIKANDFEGGCGLVTYFDPETSHGRHDPPGFWKNKRFAWQREYRIGVDRDSGSASPYMLEVGPLDDICTLIDPRDLNSQLKIQYNA